jgi:hypothetical protein
MEVAVQHVDALIGAAAALLAASLAAIATHVFGRMRASDKDALWLWRTGFDRPAFKGPYEWHSDQVAFRKAIEDSIKCINTGVLSSRTGAALGTAKPKAQIRNSEWRAVGDKVEQKLNRIRQLVPDSGAPPQDPKIMETMNRERNEIIEMLNGIWNRARIPPLPRVESGETYSD